MVAGRYPRQRSRDVGSPNHPGSIARRPGKVGRSCASPWSAGSTHRSSSADSLRTCTAWPPRWLAPATRSWCSPGPPIRARRLRGRGRAGAARARRPSLGAERQPARAGHLGQPPGRGARRPPPPVAGRRRARPRLAGGVGRRHLARGLRRAVRRDGPRHRARPPQGHLANTTSAAINAAEWWLTYEAQRVICCSGFMRRGGRAGVPAAARQDHGGAERRRPGVGSAPLASPAPRIDAPLIVSWGRLEYEKGFQTLIVGRGRLAGYAIPRLRGVHRRAGHLLRGAPRRRPRAGCAARGAVRRLRARRGAACACSTGRLRGDPVAVRAVRHRGAGGPGRPGRPSCAAERRPPRGVGRTTGLLFPPGNADALAAAFDRMTTEPGLVRESSSGGHRAVATSTPGMRSPPPSLRRPV